jgi:hypothetical protein
MISEIKICGGDYSPKMKALIEDDVNKLTNAEGAHQRFMILIVDNRHPDTTLGKWLTTCNFPHVKTQNVILSESLLIRMWEIAN